MWWRGIWTRINDSGKSYFYRCISFTKTLNHINQFLSFLFLVIEINVYKNNFLAFRDWCHMYLTATINFLNKGKQMICSRSRSMQWENMSRHPMNQNILRKYNCLLPYLKVLHFNSIFNHSFNGMKIRKCIYEILWYRIKI